MPIRALAPCYAVFIRWEMAHLTDIEKIFANIEAAKRRMRAASEAGVDLDTANPFERVHGMAAIHKTEISAREDATWWTDKDWHDEPRDESVEINVGVWVQLRMLSRPTEAAALARVARQADRSTHALGPAPDVRSEAMITEIELLKGRHPDVIAMWREAWQGVKVAERIIDQAVAEALGVSPAGRDRAWGRPQLWLKDPRRDTWFKNPEWTERVTSLASRIKLYGKDGVS